MASEDVLEDLPGDQLVNSPVFNEQSDTESSVGNYEQSRPQHGCLFFSLSIHYYGLLCLLPRSLPVKTSLVREQITCEFSFVVPVVISPVV